MTSLQTQIPSEFRGPSNSEWQLSETMVRKAGETCSCRYRKEKKKGCKIPQPSAVDKASLLSGYVRHGPEISVEADLELCAVSTDSEWESTTCPTPRSVVSSPLVSPEPAGGETTSHPSFPTLVWIVNVGSPQADC